MQGFFWFFLFLLNGKQIRFTVCKRFWTLLRFYGLYTRNNHFKIFLLLHYIDMIFYFYSEFNFGELLTNYWPRMRSDLSTVIQYLSITDRSVTSIKCLCITSLFCKYFNFFKDFLIWRICHSTPVENALFSIWKFQLFFSASFSESLGFPKYSESSSMHKKVDQRAFHSMSEGCYILL